MESWRHRFFPIKANLFFFFLHWNNQNLMFQERVDDICLGSSLLSWSFLASWVALVVKNLPAKAGDRDVGSIPGLGRSPGEGHGKPLQYSCLGNPMNRGAWRALVHGVTKRWTWWKWLSMHVHKVWFVQGFSVFCARIGAALVRVPKHPPPPPKGNNVDFYPNSIWFHQQSTILLILAQ